MPKLTLPHQMPYSFLISKEGTEYKARDEYGRVKYHGTAASTVIQAAIDAIGTGKGIILVKRATYTLTVKLLINKAGIHLIGESGTVFQGDLLPISEFDGSAYGVDQATAFNDLSLENVVLKHTGSVATGKFVRIRYVQAEIGMGSNIGGTLTLSNLHLEGAGGQTNDNYIGLSLEDIVVGTRADNIYVRNFGTGVKHTAATYWFSTNIYRFLNVADCNIAFKQDAREMTLTFIDPKFLSPSYNASRGFTCLNSDCRSVIMINPIIEGCEAGGYGIESYALSHIIHGGAIEAIGGSGWGVAFSSGGYACVEGVRFSDVNGAIRTARKTFLHGNNYYGTIGTKVQIDSGGEIVLGGYDEGYINHNSGTATIANGTSSITVNHGLAGTPTSVIATGRDLETDELRCSARTSTQITLSVPANVTADRIVDWVAKYKP